MAYDFILAFMRLGSKIVSKVNTQTHTRKKRIVNSLQLRISVLNSVFSRKKMPRNCKVKSCFFVVTNEYENLSLFLLVFVDKVS